MNKIQETKYEPQDVLGLIAGEGRLPFLVAAGAKQAGLKVICVGLAETADRKLADEVDVFYRAAIARPGGWIRRLRKHRVTRTIMVGRVSKGRLFTPWRIVQYLPDWRAFRIYYWRLRGKNTQPDSLLCAVADELASGGIVLENSIMYCKEHLATAGVMTDTHVRASVEGDIEFGWQIVKKLGELDIGQAVAVKEKEVIAVFKDLREVQCDFLTIGQYLSPSANHYPVVGYIHPDKFEEYKDRALNMGFKAVASAPFVRSSYNAADMFKTEVQSKPLNL